MIITCPACSKKYSIKPEALGGKGRSVKCKNCAHKWFQPPAENSPAAAAAALLMGDDAPEETPGAGDTSIGDASNDGMADGSGVDAGFENADRIADPPPIPRQLLDDAESVAERPPRKRGLVGWLIFVILTGGFLGGAIWQRDLVMHHLRGAIPFYAALGFEVPTVDRHFDVVQHDLRWDGSEDPPILVTGADVINISDAPRKPPVLRTELLDGLGAPLHRKDEWPPEELMLAPGESWSVEMPIRGAADLGAVQTRQFLLDPRDVIDGR